MECFVDEVGIILELPYSSLSKYRILLVIKTFVNCHVHSERHTRSDAWLGTSKPNSVRISKHRLFRALSGASGGQTCVVRMCIPASCIYTIWFKVTRGLKQATSIVA